MAAPSTTEECYAFARFRLYPRQRTLLHGDDIVPIGGRAFDLLLLLVLHAGDVVSLNELMRFVWPNVTVDEANLRVQMGLVRKALAQCEEAQRAIETVSSRGYCFILPVRHHPRGTGATSSRRVHAPSLPVLLHPTIGRDDTIGVVRAALDARPLVTITGPAGIGKTTVAIEAAHCYATTFPGEIVFVDLSHVADGAGAALAIADSLQIEAPHDPVGALCTQLRSASTLLILDTCEHIVEPISRLAEILLTHCTELKLLVTSREALRAAGEWIHRLPPLRFPAAGEEVDDGMLDLFPALALFVDRARACVRFEMQARDLPVLAEICRRLDGNPLALEFAAARVADLGLARIAANLDDRFAILTRGRRTALPRHRTLAAALDWSYGLLSDDEQRMLRHLATLGNSFTAEHAISCGRNADCLRSSETLSSLYEKSLLSVDIGDDVLLYRLLDTTRAYVARMDAGSLVACAAP